MNFLLNLNSEKIIDFFHSIINKYNDIQLASYIMFSLNMENQDLKMRN